MKLNYSGNGFSKPFRHTIIDDFIEPDIIKSINDEWPDPEQFLRESGSFTKKWHSTKLPKNAQNLVDSIDIKKIEKITGINGLIADPDLSGGGLHCIPKNGFLKMHCDFNVHPLTGWARRVNLLIYVNEVWRDEWNGHLILSDTPDPLTGVNVSPVGGRAVIFETNEATWHGHPEKLATPDGIQRRSIALYFYTKETPKYQPHSTIYHK